MLEIVFLYITILPFQEHDEKPSKLPFFTDLCLSLSLLTHSLLNVRYQGPGNTEAEDACQHLFDSKLLQRYDTINLFVLTLQRFLISYESQERGYSKEPMIKFSAFVCGFFKCHKQDTSHLSTLPNIPCKILMVLVFYKGQQNLTEVTFSNSLIIQKSKTKEIMQCDVFGYLMKNSSFLRP